MSVEQLTPEMTKKTKFSKELEKFVPYVEHFKNKAKNSIINRLAGKLSIGSEEGKDDLLKVESRAAMDRELGLTLVKKAVEAAARAEEEPNIDSKSATLGASIDEGNGVKRILTVAVKRDADRMLDTHGDMSDSLRYEITTLGSDTDEAHSIAFSVGLNGEVVMEGPEGDVTKVHAGTETADRMMQQIESFPDLHFQPELPY